MPAKKTVTTTCAHCGNTAILVTRQELAWMRPGRRPYCSLDCRDAYAKAHLGGRPPTTLAVRFWSKVQKTQTCWLWTAKRNGPMQYGQMRVSATVTKSAHHIALFLKHGVWPRYVLHTCDTPLCVRPSHLKEGSAQDNVDDMWRKGRAHIVHGENHPFAKLTTKDVEEIRASTQLQHQLATRYGVTQSCISSIRRGRKRRHG